MRGAGQYRVDTKANLLWEEFNVEYFQVLHDESEERKREESRKRHIDEAQQMHNEREQEFSNTHTPTEDPYDDELDADDQKYTEINSDGGGMPSLEKHVSWGDVREPEPNDEQHDEEIEKEFAEMAKVHHEMSQQLSLV